MALEAGRVLSNYRIVRMLGAGGMGEVYEAEDLQLGRPVALKLLPREVADDALRLRRFTAEARALASLNHPNIVTVYAVPENADERYFVMELVDGPTLASLIPPSGLEVRPLLDLGTPLADAVAAAHGKGIVHRDLKPSNVMLTGEGRLKVLDFGLAHFALPADMATDKPTASGSLTLPGTLLGTLPYIAPEHYRGTPADARSDVWALGVMLYEMATGHRPFGGSSPAELMHAILYDDPPALCAARPGTPRRLGDLVHACLAKDPSLRPASAAGVRDGLAEVRSLVESGHTGSSEENAAAAPPSIAVLPLSDMSAGQDQQYLCEGLAEELLNTLAQVEHLRVAARTSSFAFRGKLEDVREIGRRLGVDTVLEGSVRKAGPRLRITVQLVQVSDGYHLWSERFDRTDEDLFAVQDEIALAVVEKLRVKLLSGEREKLAHRHTEDREAFDLYLKGRYFYERFREGDVQRALALFRQAIERDSGYIQPYLALANVFLMLGAYGFMPPAQAFGQAKAAAGRVLAQDASCAEAHLSMGLVLYYFEWDLAGAERHVARALQADHLTGFHLALCGQWLAVVGRREEAIAAARRSMEMEPMSALALQASGLIYTQLGLWEEAIPLLERSLEMDPSRPTALIWLGSCRLMKGELEGAARALDGAVAAGFPYAIGWRGLVAAFMGDAAKVRQVCEEVERRAAERYVPAFARALAWAGAGERERSLGLLEEAYAQRDVWFVVSRYVRNLGNHRPLEPRWFWDAFAARVKSLNLPSATAAIH
jgi:TolB-like protein/lipoprotein NlpI